MENKNLGIICSLIGVAAGFFAAGGSVQRHFGSDSKQIIGITRTVGDLNGDGLEDMALIQSDQRLVPMYASRESDTHYVTGAKMKELDPRPIDYQAIEDRLNK